MKKINHLKCLLLVLVNNFLPLAYAYVKSLALFYKIIVHHCYPVCLSAMTCSSSSSTNNIVIAAIINDTPPRISA